jgi:hypothetical protein
MNKSSSATAVMDPAGQAATPRVTAATDLMIIHTQARKKGAITYSGAGRLDLATSSGNVRLKLCRSA